MVVKNCTERTYTLNTHQEATKMYGLKKQEPVLIPTNLKEIITWSGDYFATTKAILFHSRKATENYLIVGCLLSRAQKNQIHKHDGTMAKNFFNWCENEIHIKRTNAQRMIKVWETFSKHLDRHSELIMGVDFTKLALIAPYIEKMTDEDKVVDMILSAECNSYRAIEDNLREENGKIASDVCTHSAGLRIITICKDCGKTIKTEEV